MTSRLEVWCYINWAYTEASKWYRQNLDYIIFMHFSLKILKRKRDFRDFLYRYGLLQKIKNVLIICEYIFDFLKKCVPITEISEIVFPFQDFSTVFDANLKSEAKTPRKKWFSIYDRVTASDFNLYQSFSYVSRHLFVK
jgi:hypothetical protein